MCSRKLTSVTVGSFLVAVSVKNLIALFICLPLTSAMIISPSLISRITCFVHETLTFVVLFLGLLFPAVLSIYRYDVVVYTKKRLLTRARVNFLLIILTVVSMLLALIPFFELDVHGCHLWSTRVDDAVWSYMYAMTACLMISVLAMVICYVGIYRYTRTHVENIEMRSRRNDFQADHEMPSQGK